jgi:hypothetical protein
MLPDRARAEDIERMAMQFLIASHLATYSQSGT